MCSEYPCLFVSQNSDLDDDLSYFVRLTKWKVSCNDETKLFEDGTLLWQGFVNNDCHRDFSHNMICYKEWKLHVPSTARGKSSNEESVAFEIYHKIPFNSLFFATFSKDTIEYAEIHGLNEALKRSLKRCFDNFQWQVTVVAVARDRNTSSQQHTLVISSCARYSHFDGPNNRFAVPCQNRPFDPHHTEREWGSSTRQCTLGFKIYSFHGIPIIGLEDLRFFDDDYYEDRCSNDCDMKYDPTERAEHFYRGWDRSRQCQSRSTRKPIQRR